MKLHVSINGHTFELESGNSIEININGSHNFNTVTNTDENSYPPKRTVVYTVSFYDPDVYYSEENKCWCHDDRFIVKKTNDKDNIKNIIQERIQEVGGIDSVGTFYIEAQCFNENNEVVYEKDLGKYRLTRYNEIAHKEDLLYTINEFHRPVYRDALNEIKWNADELTDKFYLVRRRAYNGLEVEKFPQDVNLVSSDLSQFVYCAKQR